MKAVSITDDMRTRARLISNPDIVFNQNKTGPRAGYIGALGEIVVADYLGVHPHNNDEVYNYDMVWNDNNIEVKTMNLYYPPKEGTDCCTTTYYDQKCDMYFFVGLLNDKSKAWIEGCIYSKDFFKKANYIKKGTTRSDGFTYKWDNWVVKVKDLSSVDKVLSNKTTGLDAFL